MSSDFDNRLVTFYEGDYAADRGEFMKFHPVKPITTGEGGIITTNNETFYERLIQFRTHGITRNPRFCTHFPGPWYYEMRFLGFNYRITDLQAALGISQLKKLDRLNEKRREIAIRYHTAFRDLKAIQLPHTLPQVESSWHL